MNRTDYNGCGCGHPNAHPPCSFCTDTFVCDLCKDICYVNELEETKAGILCEECHEYHEKLQRELEEIAARARTAEKIAKYAGLIVAIPAVLLILPLIIIGVALLFSFILLLVVGCLIIHVREQVVKIENDVQEINVKFYAFIFIPFYTYTRFKQHSERNP